MFQIAGIPTIASIDLDGDGVLDLRNKEVNQVNGKLSYTIGNDSINHKAHLDSLEVFII
jgi:hypothetical protein